VQCQQFSSELHFLLRGAPVMRRRFITDKERVMIHIACAYIRAKRDKIPVYSEAMGV
jgi:hypothetical protein